MLDSFFHKVNSGQLENNNYYANNMLQNKGDGTWDPWIEDLPPLFHGSTSSLVQPESYVSLAPNAPSHNIYDFEQDTTLAAAHGQAAATSPEILRAASTLIQNGHTGHSDGLSPAYDPRGHDQGNQSQNVYATDNLFNGTYAGSYSHAPATGEGSPIDMLQNAGVNGDSLMHDMFYSGDGYRDSSLNRPTMAPKPNAFKWGSDANFLDHGFVAPPNQETVEELTKHMLGRMECLEPQPSAENTQPSSPVLKHRKRRGSSAEEELIPADSTQPIAKGIRLDASAHDFSESRPRKRRKDKLKIEEEDDQPAHPVQARTKIHRSSSARKEIRFRRATSQEDRPKTARSQPGEHRPGRENLTDEQKRSNHILSEQKRRNLIKQGFEDLCELVPDLKGGAFSKSALLTQAADWLEDLVQGNERLKLQLTELGGNVH